MLMHLGVCTVIKTYLKAKLSSSSGLGVRYYPNCVDRVFCIAGILALIILWLSKLCCFVLNSPTTAGEALSLCIVKVLYIVSYNYKNECIHVYRSTFVILFWQIIIIDILCASSKI